MSGRRHPCGGGPRRSGGGLAEPRGSALVGALLVMLLLAVLLGGALLSLEAAERTRGARAGSAVLEEAAREMIEVMTARLGARAALRLGALEEDDLAALQAELATLPTPAGGTLDPEGTGYRVVAVREREPVPGDVRPLGIWTDQPRVRYTAVPRPQGQTASRILEIEVHVRVLGASGMRRTLTRTVAVARVPPYPYALYYSGTEPELCAGGQGVTLAGAVRIDALAAFLACPGAVTLAGSLEARDGVGSEDPRARILTADGALPLESWTREAAETGGSEVLGRSLGHVRLPAAWGGTYEASRRQNSGLAGTGECADRAGACGGNGFFSPGITVQRTGSGAGWTTTCGQAYGVGGGCAAGVAAAMRYHPWPWTAPVATGVALPDPLDPDRLWRGLLFDPRREARCTATVAGHEYPTHRCPSNTFGWVLDLGSLPRVAGGLLHVRASASDPPGRAAAGAQEALVIRNAEQLAAPLSIVSDVPVFIVGSLNTAASPAWRGPPPLMIDAPRVALLPAEADARLGLPPGAPGWASVWDAVPAEGETTADPLPLLAASNATLCAVLRLGVCGRAEGGFQGGVLEQAPAALGDWSGAEVRVVGAVEQSEAAGMSAAECRWWGSGWGAAADGSPWRSPAARTVLHDPRLLSPRFVVPGSFLPQNVPEGGVPGAARRDRARQARATGGYGVMWVVRDGERRAAGASVRVPGAAFLPPPPPALPP